MHVWGDLPGGRGRRNIVLPRGRADSASAVLETVDRDLLIELQESSGRARVAMRTADGSPILRFVGYRWDLAPCFDQGQAAPWRKRLKVVVDSLEVLAPSLAYYRDELRRRNSVQPRETLEAGLRLFSEADAQLRAEKGRLEQRLDALRRCPPPS
jgi:hypothetical protein